MIEFTGLAHVGIRVRAFDRSIAFYQTLGFELVREDYRERVVVLRDASGLVLKLLDLASIDSGARNVLMDEGIRYPGFTHIALQVSDISVVQAAVDDMGLFTTEGPVSFGDGSTSLFVRDPDGNVIELSQPGNACREAATRARKNRGGQTV